MQSSSCLCDSRYARDKMKSMNITSKTLLCVSLAANNRNSLAPTMHNAAFGKLNLDYVYISLEPENIEDALSAVRAFKIAGGSISTPYKEDAVKFVDVVDDVAKTIGAVNAFKNVDGKIFGYNTDWIGAISALEEKTTIKNKEVALIGAGGAARAILYGLVSKGAKVTLYNRTVEKGMKLAKEFSVVFGGGIEDLYKNSCEIIINATTVGKDDSQAFTFESSVFKNTKILMDINTRKEGTPLMHKAKENGVYAIGGLRMLVLQGAETFKIITDVAPPVETMFSAVSA